MMTILGFNVNDLGGTGVNTLLWNKAIEAYMRKQDHWHCIQFVAHFCGHFKLSEFVAEDILQLFPALMIFLKIG